MPVKIFINGRYLTQKITGVQRNAFELTKHLLPLIKNAMVLVPDEKINTSYKIDHWPLLRIGTLKGVLWEQVSLPLFLKKQKKQSLLINLTNTAPLSYPNQVVSIMDMTTFIEPAWFNKKFAYYYQWLVPKIVKKSRVVFTISENSKRDIVKFTGIKEDKIKVLYCGISEIFLYPSKHRSDILERLGLKHQEYLMAVSSLDPRKNFKKLIESFFETNIEIPLVIVGSKGKVFGDAGISNYDSSRIIFTGYISDEDLKQLYKSSLCFVYPSLYEGFGIPPLEAMASGCATIVANTSSLPEVCSDASLYVDPYDSQSIASAIKNIIYDESLRSSLVMKGFENVKRFSWELTAAKALKEIQEVI
jgi:glycosyltransferase involved in cell wall biosynthesis